ncbi:MAG: hypothetical protein ACI8RT_001099 [Candidatus Azotimanducaceae bacterium]|jgi:uncharacterized protein YcbX|tara:strand:+ start:1074 stop:1946 length:873 start_codon:yes stop_codon:yes gene_type:complete
MPATITDIFRYPVKSMKGHALSSALMTKRGIPGDRAWALKDEERGGIKGGKRFPQLLSMTPVFASEPNEQNISPNVSITLANGQVVTSSDADINAVLSEAVGSPVSLWPILPEDQLEHYLRPPMDENVDVEAYYREIFARNPDEPLPDVSLFPEEVLKYESPPGSYFDAFPILVMSKASLIHLNEVAAAAGGQSNFDVRRFRPNILLDIDASGFPENQWMGRRAKIGSAVIKFEMPCPRCVITTHGFEDLPKDPKIMRHLVKENGGNLGAYVSIETPGTFAQGDVIELLD